jgi:hypothetical protein
MTNEPDTFGVGRTAVLSRRSPEPVDGRRRMGVQGARLRPLGFRLRQGYDERDGGHVAVPFVAPKERRMVGDGFEPSKALAGGFTVRPRWPLE